MAFDPAYTHNVQMRFSDADMMGHVNNARYLTFLEDARIGLLRQLIDADVHSSSGLIVARIEIDYRRPMTLSDEPVAVDVWVSRIGTRSFTLDYRIRQFGDCAATARTVIAAFDYQAQSTRALTSAERDLLGTWLRDTPPGQ